MKNGTETIVFGGGCFWCTEAVFKQLKGVAAVTSGYAGGSTEEPTYEQVAGGTTNHAEVVRVEFDPAAVSLRDLLEVFFSVHDPTAINRQGNDAGSQYRSVIFFTNQRQKAAAEEAVRELEAEKIYDRAVVTEIAPLKRFYEAEEEHRDYYRNNAAQPYCQLVINPKLSRFREKFQALLKD
jgi:peptide-methionine (S)-S-oxide reductase